MKTALMRLGGLWKGSLQACAAVLLCLAWGEAACVQHGYDELDRLIETVDSGYQSVTYGYDAVGDMLLLETAGDFYEETYYIAGCIYNAFTDDPGYYEGLEGVEISYGLAGEEMSETVYTDYDGCFELYDLPKGEYAFSISDEGYEPLNFRAGVNRDWPEAYLDDMYVLPDERYYYVTGWVNDQDDWGVEYADVVFEDKVTGEAYYSWTEYDGYYEMYDVPPGEYWMSAQAWGYEFKKKSVTIDGPTPWIEDVNLIGMNTATLEVVINVMDAYWNYLEQAQVILSYRGREVVTGVTDDWGEYRIWDLPAGPYTIKVLKEGYFFQPLWVDITGNDDTYIDIMAEEEGPEWAVMWKGGFYSSTRICDLHREGELDDWSRAQWVALRGWVKLERPGYRGALQAKLETGWRLERPEGQGWCPGEYDCKTALVKDETSSGVVYGDQGGEADFTMWAWWPGVSAEHVEEALGSKSGKGCPPDLDVLEGWGVDAHVEANVYGEQGEGLPRSERDWSTGAYVYSQPGEPSVPVNHEISTSLRWRGWMLSESCPYQGTGR